MRTKIFMAIAIVFLGVSTALQAQPGRGRKAPEFPNKEMIQELKLTDEQVANLKKGDAELRAKMEASRANKEISRDEIREAMKKMRAERNEMVKKNLTPEQYNAYLELEKKFVQNRFQHQGERPQGEAPQGNAPTE